MKEERKAKSELILSMFIFGTIGIFRRYIPFGSAALAMARGFIGVLSLLVILAIKKQRLSKAAIKANLLPLLLSGAFIGVNWILLFEAYNFTTVAVATLCYYMAPVIVMLASPIVLKEELTRRKIVCILAALVGMALVSGIFSGGGASHGAKGVLFGLSAAVFYASVIITNKKLHDISAYDKTVIQLGTAATVLVPYVLLTGNVLTGELTAFAVIMVLVVGVVHTGFVYALYFGSMDKLKAQTVALFGYIDPVVAIILSALLLGESLGAAEIAGSVLILCATAISELPEKK